MSSPPSRPARAPLLDVCRALAIFLVIGHHPPDGTPTDGVWLGFFHAWERVGWLGVDLFFVLSGFLIGRLLVRELAQTGTLRIKRFWAKRLWKIWPPYFVFLAVAIAWFSFRSEHTGSARAWELWVGFWPNFFHVQNYLGTSVGHTWSLAVEEHFYVVLPLLLFGLSVVAAGRRYTMPVAALVICGGALLLRLKAAASGPFDLMVNHAPTHLRFDSLFVGVLLGWAVEHHRGALLKLVRVRWFFAAVAVAAFTPFALVVRDLNPWTYTVGFTLVAFGSAALVLWAWLGDEARVAAPTVAVRGLSAIGRWSYSIYLWHWPFAYALSPGLVDALGVQGSAWRQPALMLAFSVLAVVFGLVGYHLVERPALLLRDRVLAPTVLRPQPAASSAAP